jgi:hypothetical protein
MVSDVRVHDRPQRAVIAASVPASGNDTGLPQVPRILAFWAANSSSVKIPWVFELSQILELGNHVRLRGRLRIAAAGS